MERRNVCVIGAGVSGLICGRILRDNGFTVRIYETGTSLGGTWRYREKQTDVLGPGANPSVEANFPLPNRGVKCTAAYDSLRVNLPKQIMGFSDYPFEKSVHSFMSRQVVQSCIEGYASEFDLWPMITFNHTVKSVLPLRVAKTAGLAELHMIQQDQDDEKEKKHRRWWVDGEVFDVIIVACGHFTIPLIPSLFTISSLGLAYSHKISIVIHSSRFDTAEPFRDLNVVVVGGAASGTDICWEVSKVAKLVFWSYPVKPFGVIQEAPLPPNCINVDVLSEIRIDGSLAFFRKENVRRIGARCELVGDNVVLIKTKANSQQDNNSLGTSWTSVRNSPRQPLTLQVVDAVIFATGYHYYLPFFHKWKNLTTTTTTTTTTGRDPLPELGPTVTSSSQPIVKYERFQSIEDLARTGTGEDTDDDVTYYLLDCAGNEDLPQYNFARRMLQEELGLNLFHRRFSNSLFFLGFFNMVIPILLAEAQSRAILAIVQGVVKPRKLLGIPKYEQNPQTFWSQKKNHNDDDAIRFPLVIADQQFTYVELLEALGRHDIKRFKQLLRLAKKANNVLPENCLSSQLVSIKRKYEAVAAVRRKDPLFRDRPYSILDDTTAVEDVHQD